jgi:hypothetical protein
VSTVFLRQEFWVRKADGTIGVKVMENHRSIRDLNIIPKWMTLHPPTDNDFTIWGRSIPGTRVVRYSDELGCDSDHLIEFMFKEFGHGDARGWGFSSQTRATEKIEAIAVCHSLMRENKKGAWYFPECKDG